MKTKHFILFLFATLFFYSCENDKTPSIIKDCIAAHGGQKAFEELNVLFKFRDMSYAIKRHDGLFTYTRTQVDHLGNVIRDELNNKDFTRYINGEESPLADSLVSKYSQSVNSVAYFFQLPFVLNDPAVNFEELGNLKIKGKEYSQIKVTFDQKEGGQDHQDVFMFWINNASKTLDYLAYSYATDGGGVRFRSVKKRYKIGPFQFQDYDNYGYEDENIDLEELPKEFESGDLPLLSEIVNENCKLLDN
ncbi:hypothetical protein LAG90_14350 [Marinilongibacter aquaticus]|uniref:DUF6503 family protein n=1 Tax=Marinilongibacter aquaticus TaxID=2975157 RepID=UPI0021BD76DF|nr:DUF6503 family protein [Marinilongibacter aquaticus]UBM57986.1 hypothetical protein LAG90_14350 [Marinilongibacter aquaticus]